MITPPAPSLSREAISSDMEALRGQATSVDRSLIVAPGELLGGREGTLIVAPAPSSAREATTSVVDALPGRATPAIANARSPITFAAPSGHLSDLIIWEGFSIDPRDRLSLDRLLGRFPHMFQRFRGGSVGLQVYLFGELARISDRLRTERLADISDVDLELYRQILGDLEIFQADVSFFQAQIDMALSYREASSLRALRDDRARLVEHCCAEQARLMGLIADLDARVARAGRLGSEQAVTLADLEARFIGFDPDLPLGHGL